MVRSGDFVVGLKDIDANDLHYVGARAANLGSIADKFPTAQGFVVAFPSYFEFLKHNGLDIKISHLLGAINYDIPESIAQISADIRRIIKSSHIPSNIIKAVTEGYEKMGISKALVQTTVISGDDDQRFLEREYKNYDVYGESGLLDVLRSSWASIFSPELILHRHKNGINHLKSSISAFVMRHMEPFVTGNVLTADSDLGDKSQVIVQVSSDYVEHLVDKKNFSVKPRARRTITQPHVIIKDGTSAKSILNVHEIIELARLGAAIEKHFYFPQAIDWFMENNKISVSNTRKLNFYA